jgi:hypothetical protein
MFSSGLNALELGEMGLVLTACSSGARLFFNEALISGTGVEVRERERERHALLCGPGGRERYRADRWDQPEI